MTKALLSQLAEETVLEAVKSQFESEGGHHLTKEYEVCMMFTNAPMA